jgi:hypothetical protein
MRVIKKADLGKVCALSVKCKPNTFPRFAFEISKLSYHSYLHLYCTTQVRDFPSISNSSLPLYTVFASHCKALGSDARNL